MAIPNISGINITVENAIKLHKIDPKDLKYLNPNDDKYIDFNEMKTYAVTNGQNKYSSLFNYFDSRSDGALKQEVDAGVKTQQNNPFNPQKVQNAQKSNTNSNLNNNDHQNKDFEARKSSFAQSPIDAEKNNLPYKPKKLDLFM